MDTPASRRLMRHGIILVFLALLTGAVIPLAVNPRQALAAHTGGLMLGILVAVLGIIWPRLRLTPSTGTIAFWTVLYGAYVNWASNLLAAFLGTSELTPLAGAGHGAGPWQEAIVNVGLGSSAIVILVAFGIVLYGFRGNEAGAA